jgi:sterol desaturase/sphingolipid hydroxylase (fatty acid hydroxylase superfamily)
MEATLHTILASWHSLFFWLMGLGVAFVLLARLLPCNPAQPILRSDLFTDLCYALFVPLLNRFARVIFVVLGVSLLFAGESPQSIEHVLKHGFGPLSQLPIWLQAAIIFIVSDVMLYWCHRFFHGRKLWRFHAIHHSSEHLDWLSAYRFHPVNSMLTFSLVDALMIIIGFSPVAVGLFVGFNTIYSAMVHANLNWTFGPFKYVFASPVFHRWHHTSQQEGMDKNFAPTFPLLDIVFGTFYMPEERRPLVYGVPGSDIPKSFVGQMLWPFRSQRKEG